MKGKGLFLFVLIGMLVVVGANPALAAPIEIRVANFQPPLHKSNEMLKNWMSTVETETGGKVKFTLYPGATLAKAKDTYDATVRGIADMCHTFAGYSLGRFLLSEVVILPALGMKNSEHGARVLGDLYEKFPEVRAEYKDVHLLWICPSVQRQWHGTKPIRRVEDIKGLKVRAPGFEGVIVKALGGVPVDIAGPDVYLAMQRGTIDGTFHPWETAISYRWYEVAKYHTTMNFYLAGVFIVAMNLDTYNKLPKDVQKVIDKHSGKYGAIEVNAKGMWDKYDKVSFEEVKAKPGREFFELSKEDLAKATELCRPVWDKWVADNEAKGLPGKKILDECLRLVEKYK
ncbi:MAG: TRAP transporter substrate-binding protein [Thermodesulfobacteriota bacterium]|nr:TRAP transporter substrate-binding protein [Thermodesulfobacteriota bacterium]